MFHTILLSMDSPTGASRRARLNWTPSERFVAVGGEKAPDDFQRRTRLRYNTKASTLRGVIGCAWSHVLVLRKIVEEDLTNVLVLEDDARLVAPLPPVEALPRSCAVHLGGAIRTPGAWVNQAREFPEATEVAVWKTLTPGRLHALRGFSIVGSEALFVPNAEVAAAIRAKAEDPRLRMMHWDHFLRKHALVPLLWAPNCFAASDAEASQIEGKVYLRDYYAGGVRKIKKRQALADGFWPPRWSCPASASSRTEEEECRTEEGGEPSETKAAPGGGRRRAVRQTLE